MNYVQRETQCLEAKKRIKNNIEEILLLIADCRQFTSKTKLTPKQLSQLNKVEKKLIHSLSKTPFISLPNVEQVKKSVEMSGDTATVAEANKVAEFIYDTVEMTGRDVLDVINNTSKTEAPKKIYGEIIDSTQ